MATRGWESVTQTDLARRAATRTPVKAQLKSTRQKFHAEPCLVAPDGTLFTAADIDTAELAAHARALVGSGFTTPLGTGTLIERAARCGIRGIWFASTKEGRRYLELKLLEREAAISDLRTQVPYDLTVLSKIDQREITIGKWIADFVYRRAGEVVTEDTKSAGTRTPLYRRSRRHFEAQYGMKILET